MTNATQDFTRNADGWLVPKTIADGDEWVARTGEFDRKWDATICACGHPAAPDGSLNAHYHEANQGGRCRAVAGCPCVKFDPQKCIVEDCPDFGQFNWKQKLTGMCKKHTLQNATIK